MDQRKLSDTRDIGNVGLDSEGFPSDYDPKTVRGVPGAESSGGNEYQGDASYDSQDDVREWETQGDFGPSDEVFRVFGEVMDAPTEDLEAKGEPVTDGGVPYGEDDYEGTDTLEDVDHEGPFDGAPW